MQSRRGPRALAGPAADQAAEPVRDSREVLFPRTRDVPLSGGGVVVVRPWSISLLVEVSRRLPDRLQAIFEGQAGGAAAAALIPGATDEVLWIVAQTVGLAEAQILADWSAEDLLDVALAVVEVCIEPLGRKLASLGTKLLGLIPVVGGPLPLPSTSPTTPGGR